MWLLCDSNLIIVGFRLDSQWVQSDSGWTFIGLLCDAYGIIGGVLHGSYGMPIWLLYLLVGCHMGFQVVSMGLMWDSYGV